MRSAEDAVASCDAFRSVLKTSPPPAVQTSALLCCLRAADAVAATTVATHAIEGLVRAAELLEDSYLVAAVPFFQKMALDSPCSASIGALLRLSQRLPKEHSSVLLAALDSALSACQKDHSLAPFLLGPICRSLSSDRLADGLHLLELAMQAPSGSYINGDDLGDVLELARRAGEHRQVDLMWGWMQQTRAAFNSHAASCVIISRCAMRLPTRVIIGDVQSLARAGADPTPEAQLAVIELLAAKTKPPVSLAEQLVAAWAPSASPSHMFALVTLMSLICHKGGLAPRAAEKLQQLEPAHWAAAEEPRLRQVLVYVANNISDASQRSTIAQSLVRGLASSSLLCPPPETIGHALAAIAMLDDGESLTAELATWAANLDPPIDGQYVKLACRALLPSLASGNLEKASHTVKALCKTVGVPVPEEFASWESLLSPPAASQS